SSSRSIPNGLVGSGTKLDGSSTVQEGLVKLLVHIADCAWWI
ncbi:hypothetical protein LCGC14_2758390, partial [marine sediment metagenome]